MVNRLSNQLCQNFYKNESKGYSTVTQVIGGVKLTGQMQKTELITLANQMTDRDLGILGQRINE